MKNPLDNFDQVWKVEHATPMYEYFINIVPTLYQLSGTENSIENNIDNLIVTNQYSFVPYVQTIESKSNRGIPGILSSELLLTSRIFYAL